MEAKAICGKRSRAAWTLRARCERSDARVTARHRAHHEKVVREVKFSCSACAFVRLVSASARYFVATLHARVTAPVGVLLLDSPMSSLRWRSIAGTAGDPDENARADAAHAIRSNGRRRRRKRRLRTPSARALDSLARATTGTNGVRGRRALASSEPVVGKHGAQQAVHSQRRLTAIAAATVGQHRLNRLTARCAATLRCLVAGDGRETERSNRPQGGAFVPVRAAIRIFGVHVVTPMMGRCLRARCARNESSGQNTSCSSRMCASVSHSTSYFRPWPSRPRRSRPRTVFRQGMCPLPR